MKTVIISLLIFLFAFSLRVWNLNKMGNTFDEIAYMGYLHVHYIVKGDFANTLWYKDPEHPPLARYIHGIAAPLDVKEIKPDGTPIFTYDKTYTRLTSVLFGALGVVLVFLVGRMFVSFFVGITASVIVAMLPFHVGLSQMVTQESIFFFFYTATIFTFLKYLYFPSCRKLVLTGILAGCTLATRYNAILLFPLILFIYLIFRKYNKKKKSISLKTIFPILPVGVATFFAFWPMLFFHLRYAFEYNLAFRGPKTPPPEVFFGFVIHSPLPFYVVMYLVTTPLLLILLHFVGLKSISDKKKWVLYAFVLWFVFPFVYSFYHNRQHGLRYIVELYAPFALITAIGIETLTHKISKAVWAKILSVSIIVVYLFIILLRITPYYLDYYNSIPGGAKGVWEKELFALGWWGQGYREAGLFLQKNAPKNSVVGVTKGFDQTVFPVEGIYYEKYERDKYYDYILTSTNENVKYKFPEETLDARYKIIYSVKADGASLVDVYQNRFLRK